MNLISTQQDPYGTNVANLKTRALTRSIFSDPHSVSKRLSGFLNNTWAGSTPLSVTHVNSDDIIILTDGDTTVTNHSPARPKTSMHLKRKTMGYNLTNHIR